MMLLKIPFEVKVVEGNFQSFPFYSLPKGSAQFYTQVSITMSAGLSKSVVQDLLHYSKEYEK